MGVEERVVAIPTVMVTLQTGFADRFQERAKICLVLFNMDWHFLGRAL